MDLARLTRTLGCEFHSIDYLERALRHRSVGRRNNERLEFLGDALLGAIIAAELFERFPDVEEGGLSRLRSQLVNKTALASLARELSLGDYLRLGAGELKTGGARRDSILADCMEAVIGALYMDQGFSMVRTAILRWYATRLEQLTVHNSLKDAKSCLQEYQQSRQLQLPHYDVIKVEGAAHDQVFHVECTVDGLKQVFKGHGLSRRNAEQMAASQALEVLGIVVND